MFSKLETRWTYLEDEANTSSTYTFHSSVDIDRVNFLIGVSCFNTPNYFCEQQFFLSKMKLIFGAPKMPLAKLTADWFSFFPTYRNKKCVSELILGCTVFRHLNICFLVSQTDMGIDRSSIDWRNLHMYAAGANVCFSEKKQSNEERTRKEAYVRTACTTYSYLDMI